MLPCFCAQGWRRTRRDAQDLEALIDGKNLSFTDAFNKVGDAFLLPALPRPPLAPQCRCWMRQPPRARAHILHGVARQVGWRAFARHLTAAADDSFGMGTNLVFFNTSAVAFPSPLAPPPL